jgi:hypothetical protein
MNAISGSITQPPLTHSAQVQMASKHNFNHNLNGLSVHTGSPEPEPEPERNQDKAEAKAKVKEKEKEYKDSDNGTRRLGSGDTQLKMPSALEGIPAVEPRTRPTSRRTPSEGEGMALEQAARRDLGLGSGHAGNALSVLFSAPLAWQDRQKTVHPIELLDYGSERSMLWQLFKEARRDIRVLFDFATTDSFRTAVTLGCRAIHFSGHGHPNFMIFEDGRSGLQKVQPLILRKLIQAGGMRLDFVFVSACHSRTAGETFAQAGVPHVVCVRIDARLLDCAANVFTRAFYLSLAVGDSVRQAFDIGRQAVAASPYAEYGDDEEEKFILLPEGPGLHDEPIFLADPVPKWPTQAAAAAMAAQGGGAPGRLSQMSHLPRPPEDFEGRERDMYNVIKVLNTRRLVTLVGEQGIGKTAVASAVALYLRERNIFDEVIFVRLESQADSYGAFLAAIKKAIVVSLQTRDSRDTRNSPRANLDTIAAMNLNSPAQNSRGSANNKNLHSGNTFPTPSSSRGRNGGGSSRFFGGAGVSGQTSGTGTLEELIVDYLSRIKCLLVLDHVNKVLGAEDAADVKIFLGRLLEAGGQQVKVLMTSSVLSGIRHPIMENSVDLGPLSLRAALRLFARLNSYVVQTQQKISLVASLLVPGQGDLVLSDRLIQPCTVELLKLVGSGHPAKIIKLACESDADSVRALVAIGTEILESAGHFLLEDQQIHY